MLEKKSTAKLYFLIPYIRMSHRGTKSGMYEALPPIVCAADGQCSESEHSVILQLRHSFSCQPKSQDRRSVPGSLRHSDEEVCLLDEPSIVSLQLFGRVVELEVKPAHEFGDELGYLQQADVLAYAGP